MPVEELTEDEWERRWFNQSVQDDQVDPEDLDDDQDDTLLLI